MRKRTIVSICAVLNCIFAVLLLCALFIPTKQKTVISSNIAGSDNAVREIPVIGSITNSRNAEFKFRLYGKKLYGICLYLYASGSEEGTLECTLQYDGNRAVREIAVSELVGKQSTGVIEPTELVFDNADSYSGEYTLLIEGKDILPDTQISFYANGVSGGILHYENAQYQDYYGVLYMIEGTENEHPYIWCTTFILAMGLLIGYVLCTDFREKQDGKNEKA